jgi:hypothetical protein
MKRAIPLISSFVNRKERDCSAVFHRVGVSQPRTLRPRYFGNSRFAPVKSGHGAQDTVGRKDELPAALTLSRQQQTSETSAKVAPVLF